MPSHGIVSRTVSSHGWAQAQKSCRGLDAWNTVISSSRTFIDISTPRPASCSWPKNGQRVWCPYFHELQTQTETSLPNECLSEKHRFREKERKFVDGNNNFSYRSQLTYAYTESYSIIQSVN
jgi:hypothetical protein